jgi:hypothetical protein
MPAGQPTKLTPARIKEFAELLFLGFTDEQIALYLGIHQKTIQRARRGEFCPAIKRAEIAREMIYRQRTWDGGEGWQGAAWNLERKYPTQFSKPEIQLQINNDNRQIHQTLVVTAEVAGIMAGRVKTAEKKVDDLLRLKGRNGSANAQNGHQEPFKPKKGDNTAGTDQNA